MDWIFFLVLVSNVFAVDEPHLSLSHMDPPGSDEVSIAPPQLEGEAAAAMRPSVISGYSKQFQKSLPPRFLRQQVTLSRLGAPTSSRPDRFRTFCVSEVQCKVPVGLFSFNIYIALKNKQAEYPAKMIKKQNKENKVWNKKSHHLVALKLFLNTKVLRLDLKRTRSKIGYTSRGTLFLSTDVKLQSSTASILL